MPVTAQRETGTRRIGREGIEASASCVAGGQGAVEDLIAQRGAGDQMVRMPHAKRVHGEPVRNQFPAIGQHVVEQRP